MIISLATLLANLSSIFHSRATLKLENLALRHQIGVLRRSSRKRPKLTPLDRLLWVWLSRIWSGWRSALAIVEPETVVAWHRKGFRVFWTWKVRHGQPGRPIISPPVENSRSFVKFALDSRSGLVGGTGRLPAPHSPKLAERTVLRFCTINPRFGREIGAHQLT